MRSRSRVMRIALIAAIAASTFATVPSPAQTVTVVRTRDVVIPMTSGGYLMADLYRPAVDGVVQGALPTIVVYFPYSKDDSTRFERPAIEQMVHAGFAGLLVDIRGTGSSPGEFGLLSSREIRDGYDVVEWAAQQPWSNGDIGMWGYSYPGITTAMVAALQPPHLRAIVPGSSLNDPYRDVSYPGGILASQDSGLAAWLAFHAMGRMRPGTPPKQAVANMIDAASNPGGLRPMIDAAVHPLYDDWWKDRSLDERARDIEVPALFWSGWDDVYPRGETLNYLLAGSSEKALVMGPWGHIGGASGAPLDFFVAESIRWFDIFMRTPDAEERQAKLAAVPRVRLFDVDWNAPPRYDDTWHGEWRSFTSWPPAHVDASLTLCAADGIAPSPAAPWLLRGALAEGCAQDASLPIAGAPVEATGGVSVTHDTAKGDWAHTLNDPKDQRLDSAATAFLGAPLAEAVTLTGPLQAELWAITTGIDADWVVRVVDVGPDRTRVISQGWLRASHRREDTTRVSLWHTHDAEERLTPGEPYLFRLEIWPSSYRIAAGHRLGLLVQAADTMKVTSERGAGSSRVLVGPAHPSRMVVPVRTEPGEPWSPAE
jgi:uncharacterized protein